jgi:hypothetical protein
VVVVSSPVDEAPELTPADEERERDDSPDSELAVPEDAG